MEPLIPQILYEDKHLLVAVKPAGWLSEPGGGKSFPDLLSACLTRQGKPGEIFTVHRLDRVVGGVMVFARTSKAAGVLTQAIAQRTVGKEYLAVLRGVPSQEQATLEDLLFRDASKNKTFVVKRMRKGVRDASLSYRLLGQTEREGQALSLVAVELHTGRTHQIRVQFSSRQLPLLGDIRYGSKDPGCETALWSRCLRFVHPVTGKPMEFLQLPPAAYPWDLFDRELLQAPLAPEG